MLTGFSDITEIPENTVVDMMSMGLGLEAELPQYAAADFIAGFINGVTGHEYQNEIRGCYMADGSKHMEMEMQMGVKLMSKDSIMMDMVSAPLFLGFIASFPKTLTTCAEIPTLSKDEIDCLIMLAGLAHPPKELGFSLTKTVLTNSAQINELKSGVPQNWNDQKFMESGQSLAELIKLMLAPAPVEKMSFSSLMQLLQ